MQKTLEENFTDWENAAFGYGYGSGESHTIPALKQFFSLCQGDSGNYDFAELEQKMTGPVAWLMINLLCHNNIIEYGTSPRFGWLTKQGQSLRDFIDERTTDQLLELVCPGPDYNICYPDTCNCHPDGYKPGLKCINPFWH